MPSILFVCTANQCRSPIAARMFSELQLKHNPPVSWQVDSAGTWTQTGLPVGGKSAQLARRVGIDLSNHRTTSVTDAKLSLYDWVFVMERGHQEALLTENPKLKGKVVLLSIAAGSPASDIPDPLLFDLVTAIAILEDMRTQISHLFDRISNENLHL